MRELRTVTRRNATAIGRQPLHAGSQPVRGLVPAAILVLAGICGPAAADGPSTALIDPPLTEPDVRDWQGFHAGLHMAGTRAGLTYATSTPAEYEYSDTALGYGLHVGHDWRIRDKWVLGGEFSYTSSDLSFVPVQGFGPILEFDSQIAVSMRAGRLLGPGTLAYGRLGIASLSLKAPEGFDGTASGNQTAAMIGAGIESFVSDRVTARVEVLYLDQSGDFTTSDLVSHALANVQVTAGFSYRFGDRMVAPSVIGGPALVDWNGFYGGALLGAGSGAVDNIVAGALNGPFSSVDPVGGLVLGIDRRIGDRWLIGAEAEYLRLGHEFFDPAANNFGTTGPTKFGEITSSRALSLRFGRLVQPNTLLYLKLGVSSMDFTAADDFYPLTGGGGGSMSGKQIGLGMETAITPKVTFRVEGVYTDSSDKFITTNSQSEQVELDPSSLSARIGLSWRM